MKGLELARGYYEVYGRDMLARQFPALCDRVAVGLCGEGSECWGYDDDISTDHDFEPGFCLWLTAEDEAAYGFALSRAYNRLPKEFGGYSRQRMAPVGGQRHGVQSIEAFYTRFLGAPTAPDTTDRWLYLPSASLACACNGVVFRDELGRFSAVRQALLAGYPEDIRRKKIAAHTILLAQSGLYNYQRCLRHSERGAAQLCVFHFVQHAISLMYLLANVYEPFYKWAYRGLRALPLPTLSPLEPALVALTELGNTPEETSAKQASMEEITDLLLQVYEGQSLIPRRMTDPEAAAYAVADGIRDARLRNRHIMEGV